MSKVRATIEATAVYVIVLLLVFTVHMRFFRVSVVLYATVFDAFVAAGITLAIVLVARRLAALNAFETGLLAIVWLLIGYAFAISGPTVIDRSLSFYILEKLQQRGGGIRLDRFEEVFTEEYVHEHRLVDVRLTEQIASGTIRLEGDCVRLTVRGARLASFSRWFRQNLLPANRLLMGEYSDDLIDPFRGTPSAAPDYACP
jgi:hypothetical protein